MHFSVICEAVSVLRISGGFCISTILNENYFHSAFIDASSHGNLSVCLHLELVRCKVL